MIIRPYILRVLMELLKGNAPLCVLRKINIFIHLIINNLTQK